MAYLLRSVAIQDIDSLFSLSQMVNFINLPANIDAIGQMVKKSIKCFQQPFKRLEENYYMFVIEDLDAKKLIGCSLIHAQHGTTKEPHYFLSVGQEYKYSKSLNTGFVHGTLKLGVETNGPTEIGALLLHPDYRANGQKLGKQLSFIRFLYMAIHPERFKNMVHAELMPPLDSEGNSPLWEAIGRRFLNMDYLEADLMSRKNKEFILSLYPSNNIYQTLLPAEARLSIGKVGPDTEPVKKMLEEIGFYYTQEVDPFDGGPHYRCALNEILPIKNALRGKLKIVPKLSEMAPVYLIQLQIGSPSQFAAIKAPMTFENGELLVEESSLASVGKIAEQESVAIPFEFRN